MAWFSVMDCNRHLSSAGRYIFHQQIMAWFINTKLPLGKKPWCVLVSHLQRVVGIKQDVLCCAIVDVR